jgi:ribosomal protein L29
MTLNDVKKELDELINKIENTTDSDILDELNEKKIELYNIQFMLSIGKV